MNSKIKLLLASFAIASYAQVFAQDVYSEDAEDVRGIKKCLTVKNLNVCNNANINGTLTVGNVMMNPTGLLGYGMLNSAIDANYAPDETISFASNPNAPFLGTSFNGTNGLVIENAGVYVVLFQLTGVIGGSPAQLRADILKNGSRFAPSASSSAPVSGGSVSSFVLATFASGDVLTIDNASGSPVSLAPSNDGGAIIIVIRIA